ncbi:copper resistance CopC family protein [Paenibacillus sp. CAU 1782]
MMKRVLPLILVFLLLLPGAALAHSRLDQSVPAADAVLDSSPPAIEMTFNTKIEKLSNFKLSNENGDQVETERAQVDNDTMTGKVLQPLDNGTYTVQWTIIGADGHTVDGAFAFTVNAPVQEETAAPEATPSSEPSAEPSLEPSPEPEHTSAEGGGATTGNGASTSDENSGTTASNEKSSTTNIIIFAVIGVAVGVVVALLLRRRKS